MYRKNTQLFFLFFQNLYAEEDRCKKWSNYNTFRVSRSRREKKADVKKTEIYKNEY